MKPLRLALSLLVSLSLLVGGWAGAAHAHDRAPASAGAALAGQGPAAAHDAAHPCHAGESDHPAAPGAPADSAGSGTDGCCHPLCLHLCTLASKLLQPAGLPAPPPASGRTPDAESVRVSFASHDPSGVWRPPRR